MKLVDMTLPPRGDDDGDEPAVSGDGDDKGPRYPYGLRLSLDQDQLDKLPGVKELEVGTKVMIEARGVVESYSENERQGNEPSCRIEIQITGLAVSSDASDAKQRAAGDRLNELGGTAASY